MNGVPFDDRGLLLGDGLFETLLALDGRLLRIEAHLDRLAAGCAVIGLPAPDRARAKTVLNEALAGVDSARAAVRLTLTAGSGGRGLDRPANLAPRLFAVASPAQRPDAPARLATSVVRRNEGSPASRLKTLAYLDNVLARREAQARGADEALMLNGRGEVACGAAANVFWIRNGRLFTPALACGVLAGVMRAEVIAAAERLAVPVIEAHADAAELVTAEAIFLTNTLIGVRPVAELDRRRLGEHVLAERLTAAIG